MKFTDWKSEFNQLYIDVERGSLIDDLIRLDWKNASHSQLFEFDDDVFDLSPEDYCRLLPILLDALSEPYHNLMESTTFDYLLRAPKARLEFWEENHQQRHERYQQARIDRVLTEASARLGVEFDPNERPRHDLLALFNNRQRSVLRTKIDEYLSNPAYFLGYEDHPFECELKDLSGMLSEENFTA